MPITSTITYKTEQSGTLNLLVKVTTTVTTAPDTPEGTVVTEEVLGMDYSSKLEEIAFQISRVASALETSDSTNFADAVSMNSNRIASSLETSDSTNFADNIAVIRSLAEGDGIHTLGAYDPLTLASAYRYMVEEASLLSSPNVSEQDRAASEQRLLEIINKIKDLPKGF